METEINYTIQDLMPNILCCVCGVSFKPSENNTNICLNCITNRCDITEGITKQGILNYCRFCKRYMRPPWVYCERESKELLALCLKKVRGLNKAKIIEAIFIWTEPHSRVIKLKVTIQKEVFQNSTIQQSFIVDFSEHYMQCDDCKKEFTPHTWGAVVQVRQKTEHKKTFFFLEQLILKHNAHDKVIKVEEIDDGLDFFYKNKTHAMRLVDFLDGVIPLRIKASKQLVGHDDRTNIFNYKYCWCLEIPKICRDDLVVLPKPMANELGGISRLQVCYKVSTAVHLLDINTLKSSEITAEKYFHYENDIEIMSLRKHQTEFLVLKYEPFKEYNFKEQNRTQQSANRSCLDAFKHRITEVEISRVCDWKQFVVKTHLGEIAKCGDSLVGFDLTSINSTHDNLEEEKKKSQDVILVKKLPERKNTNQRIWKLRRMEMEDVLVEEQKAKGKKKGKPETKEKEFEEFMEDIETDKDLRKQINLYRDEENLKKKQQKGSEKGPERKIKSVIKAKDQVLEVKEAEKELEKPEQEDEIQLNELLADLKIAEKPGKEEPEEEDESVQKFLNQLEIKEEKQ